MIWFDFKPVLCLTCTAYTCTLIVLIRYLGLTNPNSTRNGDCFVIAEKISYTAVDWVKFLRLTRHKIDNFGDCLPSQFLGLVLKKLKGTQTNRAKIALIKTEKHTCSKLKSKRKSIELIINMCISPCTIGVHNTSQNSFDNLPSYLQIMIIAQMLSTGGKGSM